MSIKRMTAIWDSGDHKGTPLVILLALADYANDDGYCWPGVEALAQRARVSRTTLMDHLERLEFSGDLIVKRSNGRSSEYIVLIGLPDEQTQKAMKEHLDWSPDDLAAYRKQVEQRHAEREKQREKKRTRSPILTGQPVQTGQPVTTATGQPVQTAPVNTGLHDPSLPVIEPSKDSVDADASTPNGHKSETKTGPRTDKPRWDAVFDMVKVQCFKLPPDATLPRKGKTAGSRLAAITDDLLTIYPTLTADMLKAACDLRGEQFIPREPTKIAAMVGEYMQAHNPNRPARTMQYHTADGLIEREVT